MKTSLDIGKISGTYEIQSYENKKLIFFCLIINMSSNFILKNHDFLLMFYYNDLYWNDVK